MLVVHTQIHFDSENKLMRSSGFPAIKEHMDEHRRIPGELRRMADKVLHGSVMLARSYLREQLPQWFTLHAATRGSAQQEARK